jgi:2,4-dienoyl-CoA reductase-like NADH-dependent reductase (Old Yellow Enzyme family)
MFEALFEPFETQRLKLKNRIVMAPMTRWRSAGGVPGPDVAAYYARRAAGGVSLIISEGTLISRAGASDHLNLPNFYGEESLAGWQQVVNDVHAQGAKIFPQLWHQGLVRRPGTGPNPDSPTDSPSGIDENGQPVGLPMDDADIEATVDAFADAAEAADRLGFDGLELHGAHGYLFDQFFWPRTNRRTDAYGGDIAGRTRFAVEVIRGIRARVGDALPISFRVSQWKQQDYAARLCTNPAELENFLIPLVDAGVDIFHCSQRRYWEPEFGGSALNLAGWVKKLSGRPTITVGSVGLNGDFRTTFAGKNSAVSDIHGVVAKLEHQECDLIAVGRMLIGDPQWPNKIRMGDIGSILPFRADALTDLT